MSIESKQIIEIIVTIVVALIGAGSIKVIMNRRGNIKQKSKNGNNEILEQKIENGNKNIQAGSNVEIRTKDWK